MYFKCLLTLVLCCITLSLQNIEKSPPNDLPANRIIGGNIVPPHSIPYQAFLNFVGDTGTWSCGGSLITRNFVLTAGRCCYGASSVEVILGAHNISEEELTQIKLTGNDITIHPNFKTDVEAFIYENDIAVIHLPDSITLTKEIQTVKLPTSDDQYVNQTGKVSGWGLTDGFTNTSYSRVLLSQEDTIISNEVCTLVYYDLKEYDICMRANDTSSPCVGDYGSPLVVNGVQVGFVSQGVMFCIPGYPFVYTRVTSFVEWIKDNTDYKDGDDPPTAPTDEPVTDVSTPTTTDNISTTPSCSNTVIQNFAFYILVTHFFWIIIIA